MENAYMIHRLPQDIGALQLSGEFEPGHLPAPYRSLNEAEIAHYEWGGEYRPPAFARAGWNERGLYAIMYALEDVIRADETAFGGRVCEDSCLEFFLMPAPGVDDRYVNVEANPLGVAHIGIGAGRGNRRVLKDLPGWFSVTHSAHAGNWWAVSYELGAEFFEAEFGIKLAAGHKMRGNFYTCDESVHPHFGTHFPIKTQRPDFHRPEFFGEMVLV